ncbi:DMT family transporter [Microbulbifer variabilis]|jgi:quaternary ammonium compound-resistance protein SugE|uniref:Guanidinium exporter n=1 Tax=Microbulbifer variabilis TaxID=266805 RepID=A0ABY4V9J4_9GAMM|nr:multidrug efflux SMR transporter [Microbulbifer variabilis]USD20938.1 multidrug efflux SMR transporter [Microbulbifer variabilis]
MAWFYLLMAGLCEIGWVLGLKISQETSTRLLGVVMAVVFIGLSGFLLWLAQREIPIGISYAVWTSIGAAGAFLMGVIFFGETASLGRYLGVLLIIVGVVTLKLAR